jgi:HEAT repeat protein
LLGILQSDASLAAKRGVCKRLGLIATERSVATLAGMLTSAGTSDMARYSLERIPSPAVEAALREALPKTQSTVKIGIINSLGDRKDSKAVAALGKLLEDSDEAVARAAAWALGRIGGGEATHLLAAGKDRAAGRVRLEVLDAYLICAGRLLAEGDKAGAVGIYNELNAAAMPGPIRRAASRGIEKAASL